MALRNSGKVGFTYAVLSAGAATAARPLPGVPLVVPSTVSTEVARVMNPGPVSGCPGRGLWGKNGEKTEKKTPKTKSSWERQGCKQLLLGDREGQRSAFLIDSVNGLLGRVALLSHRRREAGVLGGLPAPQLPSPLLVLALEPDGAASAEGHLTQVV